MILCEYMYVLTRRQAMEAPQQVVGAQWLKNLEELPSARWGVSVSANSLTFTDLWNIQIAFRKPNQNFTPKSCTCWYCVQTTTQHPLSPTRVGASPGSDIPYFISTGPRHKELIQSFTDFKEGKMAVNLRIVRDSFKSRTV